MIYICVPTYNEAPTVGVLLWKIRQVMAEFPRDYQILVVDDASTDNTAEVLEPYTRVLPLTVMRHSERAGYAASLERLLREAVRRSSYPRRDVVVTLQADFTEDPREIPTLVKAIEGGADAVTTSASVLAPTTVPASVRWGRRTLGWLLRRYEWPDPVTDPTSGFRAYRLVCVKKALQATNGDPLLDSAGLLTNALLLRAVGPHCRRVEETSVTLRYEHRHRETRFRLREAASAFIRFARSPAPVAATSVAGTSHETQVASDGAEPAGGGGGAPRAGRPSARGRPRTGSRSGGSRQGARRDSARDDAGQPTRARPPGAGDRRKRSSDGPRSDKRQGSGTSEPGAPASSRNAPESEGKS